MRRGGGEWSLIAPRRDRPVGRVDVRVARLAAELHHRDYRHGDRGAHDGTAKGQKGLLQKIHGHLLGVFFIPYFLKKIKPSLLL